MWCGSARAQQRVGAAEFRAAYEAVKLDGRALGVLDEALRRDRAVVLAAVQQDGRALRYAATELQGDRTVVLAAVRQNGQALEHASEHLQHDREVMIEAVLRGGLGSVPCGFGGKCQAVLEAMSWYVAGELQRDGDVMLQAATASGQVWRCAVEEFQQDCKILFAVMQWSFASEHARWHTRFMA
mmetsp:Transcript_130373/g.325244  ORF Transcript_130373/g.325244 Transcript_130373/m.325244 type:complete len:184 (+) Transcript_130373:1-552(+)